MSDNKMQIYQLHGINAIGIHRAQSWIVWFFILFYNFGGNQDFYDAIVYYLMK